MACLLHVSLDPTIYMCHYVVFCNTAMYRYQSIEIQQQCCSNYFLESVNHFLKLMEEVIYFHLCPKLTIMPELGK